MFFFFYIWLYSVYCFSIKENMKMQLIPRAFSYGPECLNVSYTRHLGLCWSSGKNRKNLISTPKQSVAWRRCFSSEREARKKERKTELLYNAGLNQRFFFRVSVTLLVNSPKWLDFSERVRKEQASFGALWAKTGFWRSVGRHFLLQAKVFPAWWQCYAKKKMNLKWLE